MSSEFQNKKQVLVIGGGIAGTEASVRLSGLGYQIILIEQSDKLGGKLNQWDRLFPEQKPAKELQQILVKGLNNNIKPLFNTTVCDIQKNNGKFKATLSDGQTIVSDAVLLTTGYDLFDARKKEEYGYGIYDNVITSADLEKIFREGHELKTAAGKTPKRIGLIHCVGSRDEKAGNTYCSQVCCITAVKQAIEIKEILPQTEVFCFYMDLRMFGRHFEDIYKKAQVNHNIQFIRGRLSEAFENSDGTVMLKAEDTLLNKPLKINVDMVVLMVGMTPSKTAAHVSSMLKTNSGTDGFIAQPQGHYRLSGTNTPGVFSAGACTGPKTIEATLNDARSAAMEIAEYLKNSNASLN